VFHPLFREREGKAMLDAKLSRQRIFGFLLLCVMTLTLCTMMNHAMVPRSAADQIGSTPRGLQRFIRMGNFVFDMSLVVYVQDNSVYDVEADKGTVIIMFRDVHGDAGRFITLRGKASEDMREWMKSKPVISKDD
jgi:hypothetical protein